MRNQFKALTLSYKNAPIVIREAVALNEIACKNLLDKIKETTEAKEVLVLSTCNRTEVYYAADKDYSHELIKLIAQERGFTATKEILPYFQHITQHDKAVQHLFRVTLGLESQVVGDMQIMNQVKKAYHWSADAFMAGPFLHRLMHTVFFSNKRVVNETNYRDGAASVSYATVELVEQLTRELDNPRVLMIGVGEIGTDVCDNFQKSAIRNIIISNRTHHKAQELAMQTSATAVYWENVWDEIKKADVVISSVPGDCFFISKEEIEKQGGTSEKFFIDLSMPRSIDNGINLLPGASVYNIDSIRNRTSEVLERRIASIPEVEGIIAESTAEFQAWTREMIMSPAIQQFKQQLEQIRQQEIARYQKNLGEQERQIVENITRNILHKIVKLPAMELKAACQRGESDLLIEGLSALFSLEKQQEQAVVQGQAK